MSVGRAREAKRFRLTVFYIALMPPNTGATRERIMANNYFMRVALRGV